MQYIYAALLLNSAGKEITEKEGTSVLKSAGIEADDSRVKALVATLEGVDIEEAIAKSVALAPSATGAPAPADEAPAAAEVEKEEAAEEEEEKKEEESLAGLGALFG
jgi:large subunit ribosomal protein L12